MKFTLSWLKSFLSTELSISEISHTMTDLGLEVEAITDRSKELEPFTVAEILEAIPHPNADKLKVCKVKTGEGELQIVCGAPNARAGIKVILAKVGTYIPNGQFQIKAAEIRGVQSNGMLCSESELLIGNGDSGIVELHLKANVGDKFAKYLGLDDPVFEVSITPNRPDCLGVLGIARDLAAKGAGKLIDDEFKKIPSKNLGFSKNFDIVPNFAILEIKNIKNCESPDWLKLLLRNIGQTPISAVVDITNYICNSYARPLHAYDKDKLSGDLKVTLAEKGEKFLALNDKIYELQENDIVVRSNSEIEALAGIIGSHQSACDSNTRNIVLESAIFNPVMIAKTGRRLHIDTDSRHKMERGLDKNFVAQGLYVAASMISEICGGEVGEIKISSELNLELKKVEFDISYLKQRTGLEIDIDDVSDILMNLGFSVVFKSETILLATVPSYRLDISTKEDLAEEIARIHGYDKISCVALPDRFVSRALTSLKRRGHDAKRILASLGYNELITWSFMHSKKAEAFGGSNAELMLQNPISSELDYMRPSIIPNLLDALNKNLARSFHNLAFFEVGPVFVGRNIDDEKIYIAGIRCGSLHDKTFHCNISNVDVFDIKSDINLMLNEIGIDLSKCQILDEAPAYYHPTRSAQIMLGKTLLGYFGEIHPDILEDYDIKKRAVAFEINLSALPPGKLKYGNKGDFVAIDFQPVQRDFAFVIDSDIPAGNLLKFIQNIDKKLIKKVSFFDLYEGDKIDPNKKSLAFNVLIQSDSKTLNEDEINIVCNDIINKVCSKFAASLRG